MRYVAVSAITFIFGTFLFVLGAPRTIGAFVSLPSGPILSKIQMQKSVQQNQLEILIASQKRSLFWGETGRKWTDLSLAQLLMAEQAGSDESARNTYIKDAIASLKNGLGLSPANSFAWTRLAYAEILMAVPSQSVASKLKMSLATAPYEPQLMNLRLELCLRVWPYFQDEDRKLVFEQIRYAWSHTPKHSRSAEANKGYKEWLQRRVDKARENLVELVVRLGRVNVARAALIRTSTDLSEFERRLRKHLS